MRLEELRRHGRLSEGNSQRGQNCGEVTPCLVFVEKERWNNVRQRNRNEGYQFGLELLQGGLLE